MSKFHTRGERTTEAVTEIAAGAHVSSRAVHTDSLYMCLSEVEEDVIAAAAAPEAAKDEVAKDTKLDARPKAKQKGTFSSLGLQKQTAHRKGSSGKSGAVKGVPSALLCFQQTST